MEIAVVDDERSCREEMAELLRAFGADHHCRLDAVPFDCAGSFLDAFGQNPFPIVFLDIFLDGMDGLDAAARLRELDKKCLLIFLTSSEDFRPDALAVHAFEYITKPVLPERVFSVLEDALAVLPPLSAYIEVVSERRTVPLALADIVSVVTDAHYVDITLTGGAAVRSRMTMPEFLRLTGDDPRFILVNKGITLNADHVVRFEGSCCVTETGARFPVRVRDRAQVERAVRDYHFANIRGRQRH